MAKFFVYLDFTNDGEVFYVGKGNEKRCLKQKRNWLHQFVCDEEGFNRAIVFESENEQECFDKEIELIKEYCTFWRYSKCSDNACNFTKGGNGITGWKHSIDSLVKMKNPRSDEFSEKMKGNQNSKGFKRTTEFKSNVSRRFKGIPKTSDHKNTIRQTLSGRKLPKTHCENIRLGNLGKSVSDKTKEKIRETMTGVSYSECRKQNVSFGVKRSNAIKRYRLGLSLKPDDHLYLQLIDNKK